MKAISNLACFTSVTKEKVLIQIGTRNRQKIGHTCGELPGVEKLTQYSLLERQCGIFTQIM